MRQMKEPPSAVQLALIERYQHELAGVLADAARPLGSLEQIIALGGVPLLQTKKADGFPGLFLMAKNGREDVLRLLLGAGFDPSHRFDDERTAAMDAALAGQAGCLRILLEAGADANAINDRGSAVGTYAIAAEEPCECIRELRSFGARFDMNVGRGMPPVFAAAAKGDLKSLALMLALSGASPRAFSGMSLGEWANAHMQHEARRIIERHEIEVSSEAAEPRRAMRI